MRQYPFIRRMLLPILPIATLIVGGIGLYLAPALHTHAATTTPTQYYTTPTTQPNKAHPNMYWPGW